MNGICTITMTPYIWRTPKQTSTHAPTHVVGCSSASARRNEFLDDVDVTASHKEKSRGNTLFLARSLAWITWPIHVVPVVVKTCMWPGKNERKKVRCLTTKTLEQWTLKRSPIQNFVILKDAKCVSSRKLFQYDNLSDSEMHMSHYFMFITKKCIFRS